MLTKNLFMPEIKMLKILNHHKGQSAVELAIFGSILIFVLSLIFRQGLSGGNFMRVQLQATRYAMSKSLEMTMVAKPGRNNASVLVVEDRLSGDFGNKFGSRDRVPLIASGSASFSNQLFYPVDYADFGDLDVLSHQDMWINGQRFSFTTAAFKVITMPPVQGSFVTCGTPHPLDSRCWDPSCAGVGCLILQKIVQNYPGSGYSSTSGNFDLNFMTTDPVAAAGVSKTDIASSGGAMAFMWQWQPVPAVGELSTADSIDVDGDFYEEQILASTVDHFGRTLDVYVIDRQSGDLDFTGDGRRPNMEVGLLSESRMYSFTQAGTFYRIREGKLFGTGDQFIRNANSSDQVDIVERIIQLSNDTNRFCNGNTPNYGVAADYAWKGPSDTPPEQSKACNNCFSPSNVRLTCFDALTLRLYVRSNIINQAQRNWVTRTETP